MAPAYGLRKIINNRDISLYAFDKEFHYGFQTPKHNKILFAKGIEPLTRLILTRQCLKYVTIYDIMNFQIFN